MHSFQFDPLSYPVSGNKRYAGKFRFAKHYYPVPASLKDGGEEWRCALAIDQHPRVRHRVRNLDSDPTAGFWLPTSFGRFYPDFVCELMDGRLFVVEYKGEQIRGMAKEIEKAQVGKIWPSAAAAVACSRSSMCKMESGTGAAARRGAGLTHGAAVTQQRAPVV